MDIEIPIKWSELIVIVYIRQKLYKLWLKILKIPALGVMLDMFHLLVSFHIYVFIIL